MVALHPLLLTSLRNESSSFMKFEIYTMKRPSWVPSNNRLNVHLSVRYKISFFFFLFLPLIQVNVLPVRRCENALRKPQGSRLISSSFKTHLHWRPHKARRRGDICRACKQFNLPCYFITRFARGWCITVHKEREYNSVMYHLWYVHCLGLHFAQSLTMHLVINVLTTVFSYELFYYTTGLMSYCYVVKRTVILFSSQRDWLRSDFQIIFFNTIPRLLPATFFFSLFVLFDF